MNKMHIGDIEYMLAGCSPRDYMDRAVQTYKSPHPPNCAESIPVLNGAMCEACQAPYGNIRSVEQALEAFALANRLAETAIEYGHPRVMLADYIEFQTQWADAQTLVDLTTKL